MEGAWVWTLQLVLEQVHRCMQQCQSVQVMLVVL